MSGTSPRLWTFVFTDIEGSTRLLREIGEAYADLLRVHDAIISAAAEAHGGEIFGSEGDAQFLAFEDPLAATLAAVEAQRALATHTWQGSRAVRVRMGIHTGSAQRDEGSFVGLALHETARISAAGHGGQILLSGATVELVRTRLPAGTDVRDLGQHSLKDFEAPVHVFQLQADGLEQTFPPLRTRRVSNVHLPSQLTSFVERDEVDTIVELSRGTRLITLTGPGGTGKTRLAIAVAEQLSERFPDGTWFVGLDAVRESRLVAAEIATTLGLATGTSEPARQVAEHLRDLSALLLLDNLEQVADAAPDIAHIVGQCPGLLILATSRIPLRIYGEQEFPVPPLPLPVVADSTSLERLGGVASVRLFEERARAVRPSFVLDAANASDVAEIVARLDGLPLAIELAAARLRLLPLKALRQRLDDRLATLQSGARDRPERQQTLRGAIAWSHDLLDEPDRRLFARLGVFAGDAALEQIELITGPAGDLGRGVHDAIGSLVEQSLVRLIEAESGEPRFGMLAVIREFAREQLGAGSELEVIGRRHAETYLALAEEAAPNLVGEDGGAWNDRLEQDHDDLRAALDWVVSHDEAELGLRLLIALWRFWQVRGHLYEAEERVHAVLAMPSVGSQPADLRSRAEAAAGGVAYWRSQWQSMRDHYIAALALARETGDRALLAEALYNAGFAPAGASGSWHERVAQGAAYFTEALELFRADGDQAGVARASWSLAVAAAAGDDVERARRLASESLDAARAVGDRYQVGWSLHTLGLAELAAGDMERASSHISESLDGWVTSGDISGIGLLLIDAAVIAGARGRDACQWRLFGAEERIRSQTGANLGDTANEFPSLDPRRTPETEDERTWFEEGRALSTEAAVELAREVALSD